MKKLFTFIAMMAFTITAMAGIVQTKSLKGAATPIVFDVVDADVSETEIWNIYENEDYKLHLDIVKNLPLDPARTYTLEDMEVSYSYIYDKNEVVAAQFGKNWKRYEFTSISVKVGANNELEAVLEAKNGEDVISGTFVFNNPNPITVTLNGETEYVADLNTYKVSAKNKGSELKADYVVNLGIKGASYESKKTFTIDDLTTNGNSITVATKETKIAAANITLTVNADSQTFEGTVIGADDKTYAINVTTNIPSKEAKKETVDFGAVLAVSEDEGDIKLVAENEDAKFVGYITVSPVTTDVPSGEYTLLSYTKYGKNSDFGYMLDAVEDGKVTVTNNEGEISIVATFKQNNVEYTVTAKSAAPGPELETVTITEGEGTYTVTSTSSTAAILYLCKPMSWLDEGETPEAALNTELAGMASMIDSEETWELYDHMGCKPAPKTFTVSDYQEMYGGEEMFLIAANIGWDGEKLGIISNVALQYFTVPTPTGITNVTVAPAAKAVVKFVENGKLVIVKDNKTFNAAGQRM